MVVMAACFAAPVIAHAQFNYDVPYVPTPPVVVEEMLRLAAVGPDESILFCPANHSPPTRVAPYPGAPGFEAVATCLASPEVRARTEGVIAWRPQVA